MLEPTPKKVPEESFTEEPVPTEPHEEEKQETSSKKSTHAKKKKTKKPKQYASPTMVVAVTFFALAALIIPLFFSSSYSSTTDDTDTDEIIIIDEQTAQPPTEPEPIDTSPEPTPVELALDPMTILTQGLSAYKSKLQADGGVEATLITADTQNIQLSLLPNGDYRALTDVSTAPEWLFVNSQMYARLGQKELTDQQAGLLTIGKPEAKWTNAAVGADKQSRFLNAGNITNAISELVPLMQNLTVKEGPNGNKIVEGTIDPATASTNIAEIYNLGIPGADPTSVAFTVDASDILVGYVVTPAGSGQPVSLRITQFSPIVIETPPLEEVITLEDLASVANPTPQTPATPPATPETETETQPEPAPTE